MPRFAVLTHDHPFLHWDFLLEDGAAESYDRLAELVTSLEVQGLEKGAGE